MFLTEVKSESDKKDFLKVHVNLNRSYKNWIRPLDQDIEHLFNPKKNGYFRHGDVV